VDRLIIDDNAVEVENHRAQHQLDLQNRCFCFN
jgi:hypothetical protein